MTAQEKEETRRFVAKAQKDAEALKVAAARKQAEEARKVAAARKQARERRSSQFHGPCKHFCKQYCACCVSADGWTLYGCVPIANSKAKWGAYRATINHPLSFIYTLPLCLHMCLCPQQGCDPCAGDDDGCGDRLFSGLAQLVCVNPFLCCSQGENDCW